MFLSPCIASELTMRRVGDSWVVQDFDGKPIASRLYLVGYTKRLLNTSVGLCRVWELGVVCV